MLEHTLIHHLTTSALPRFILLIATIFITTDSSAQRFSTINYTLENGLPTNNVYFVDQDREGFIWLSTEKGVSRFDGKSFTNFTVDHGLGGNEIFESMEDRLGRIWFRSYNGQVSYYYDGVFYNKTNSAIIKNIMEYVPNDKRLSDIHEDRAGRIWFYWASGIVGTLDTDSSYTWSQPTDRESSVLFEKPGSGEMWLMEYNRFINLHTGDTLPPLQERGTLGAIMRPYTNASGEMLVNFGEDLFFYSSDQGDVQGFEWKKLDFGIKKEITNRSVTYLYFHREYIWILTHNGIIWFEKDGTLKSILFEDFVMSSAMRDREGNYWFTSLGEGAFMAPSLRTITYDARDGLPDQGVLSVAVDSQKTIWLGFDNNVISQIHSNNRIETERITLEKTSRRRIRKIYHINADTTIVGTDNFIGLYVNDQRVNQVTANSRDLYYDDEHRLWLAVGEEARVVKELPFDDNIIKQVETWTIKSGNGYAIEAFKGEVFIGTTSGLQVADYEGRQAYYISDHPLLRRRISALANYKDYTLWIGTYDSGLIGFSNGGLISITTEEGLADNSVNDIQLDEKGDVWVATSRGLSHVQLNEFGRYDIRNYTTQQGLASNEVNDIDYANGRFYLATQKGLTVFHPNDIPADTAAPIIRIMTVSANDKEIDWKSNPQLPSNLSDLKVEYSALLFYTLGDFNYRYKLGGEDTIWHYTRNATVDLSSLASGDYNFEIQAAGPNQNWSQSAGFSFSIETPLWSTWWFLVLIQLLILFAVVYVFFIVLRGQRRKNQLMQRVNEAEQAALRSQMNPHFVFNSLNTIQRYIIENDKKQAYNYLEKFGSLIRKTLEFSRQRFISVQEEVELLRVYLELECLRFENKFDYSIEIDEAIDLTNSKIPPMLLQPFVENAIRHGIHPKESGRGRIEVVFTKEGKMLRCTVADNGIGRAAAANLKKMSQHKSVALALTKERLGLLEKKYKDKYQLKITDLKQDGLPAGTTVELSMPVLNEF